MKFKPLFDNVILKKVEVEEKPVTGIILSGDNKDKTELGEVIAVRSGDTKDGKTVKMQLKVGDRVVYSKYRGEEKKIDGESYIFISQFEILAVEEN